MSRSLMVALFAVGCLTAAAGGSYLAVRQNAVQPMPPAATPASPAVSPGAPVHETEGVIEVPNPEPPSAPVIEPEAEPVPPRKPEPRRRLAPAPRREQPRPVTRAATAEPPVEAVTVPPPPADIAPDRPPLESPSAAERTAPPATPLEPWPVEPILEEIVIPASAVIGLEIETTITSERARIEDRVDARVTRDVFADGRLALPAGSRVIGAVTLVERGGKVKERARLGVRFHTVVLASGRQVRLSTEPIFRDGESPVAGSSRKIGGAAIGGAVLGAILGGGKGALAGATAGAAGGTAAVMTGDRKPAVLASGSILTVKLASPVSFDVER